MVHIRSSCQAILGLLVITVKNKAASKTARLYSDAALVNLRAGQTFWDPHYEKDSLISCIMGGGSDIDIATSATHKDFRNAVKYKKDAQLLLEPGGLEIFK